jgi:hypothetical protein
VEVCAKEPREEPDARNNQAPKSLEQRGGKSLMPGNFDFRNLTAEVRQHMLAEINQDIADDVLVKSKRFTEDGAVGYPPLLRSAAVEYNEGWLAERLKGSFNATELSAGKIKAVRHDAHILFAQNEFNRFYCRAICLYALANPNHNVRIYRARQSKVPRAESEAKLSQTPDAAIVLKDLRDHLGTDVEFGLPEIYSGLSLELVLNANAV